MADPASYGCPIEEITAHHRDGTTITARFRRADPWIAVIDNPHTVAILCAQKGTWHIQSGGWYIQPDDLINEALNV